MSTQATQAAQAIIKCELEMSIPESVSVLKQLSGQNTARYEEILQKVLDTGYDINSNHGELLLTELYVKTPNADIIKLLFSKGAKIISPGRSVYEISALGHPFIGGRVYKPDVAQQLYDHIMAMSDQDFEVIQVCFRGHHSRIDVFNELALDTDKAALYKRAGILPYAHCSVEIQNLAGLQYPARALSTAEQLVQTQKDNQALAEEMKLLKEQLTKATGIISKLTALN